VAKNMKKNVVGPFKIRPCGGSNLIHQSQTLQKLFFKLTSPVEKR